MKTEKMNELSGLTRIFPRRALNFWNARREAKRLEYHPRDNGSAGQIGPFPEGKKRTNIQAQTIGGMEN